ncbi:TIGR03086 family metal-binding protein [Segeticoccus rhizosphaerae]|uniref:TIGR03086 family metal-binding protein n=1 Tax=Segeticoccus rhizosphaerae TaxID=1104777 RepID=UPI0012645DD4|nr:TIGR03086 family metal-binding protein [Segeticoccus rhizosphaerae]
MSDDTAAERHRRVAQRFGSAVAGVAPGDWDSPAPVAGWTARHVLDHLLEWSRAFLASGAGVELPAGPSTSTDPAGAWAVHAAAVQELVEEPGDRSLSNPHTGDVPLAVAIDQFYTSDVFMHTWDLARATHQDDRLDEAECANLLAGMEPLDQMLRESGQYGARVPVPDDATAQDRLVAFIGRDPLWRPPARS